jgi:SAM-dependent methyltransferase
MDEELHRRRARSFGEVAGLYDAARPGYPERLFDDVVRLLPGPRVVDVGAGTGKATGPLVARGLRLTCVEPDRAMAAVLARRYRVAAVVVDSFEGWTNGPVGPDGAVGPDGSGSPGGPQRRRYDGLVSAQAWHWTAPDRWTRAARLLRPGGLLAVWWNVDGWGSAEVYRQIDEVYAAHGLVPERTEPGDATEPEPWPQNEMRALAGFECLPARSYPCPRDYRSGEYTALLATTSFHRMLAAPLRSSLLAGIGQVVDRHGGRLRLDRRTDAFLARRR